MEKHHLCSVSVLGYACNLYVTYLGTFYIVKQISELAHFLKIKNSFITVIIILGKHWIQEKNYKFNSNIFSLPSLLLSYPQASLAQDVNASGHKQVEQLFDSLLLTHCLADWDLCWEHHLEFFFTENWNFEHEIEI